MSRTYCPNCGTDLREGGRYREIGYEIPEVYDGILFWVCPDCDHAWPRWAEGRRGEQAAKYVDRHNECLKQEGAAGANHG